MLIGSQYLSILNNIQFDVEPGQFATLLGPSGCGKSTLLKLILGLDRDYEGSIKLGDELIRKPGLDRGIVFQETRLLPWLSVYDNIAFALPNHQKGKQGRVFVEKLINLSGLTGFEKAWPNQLSGGMAQRVAIARALVNLPDLLLLDEPFAALDSLTRMSMQAELFRILSQEGATTLMVTHDIDEAIFLSDLIIILSSRPATLKEVFEVKIPKPRNRTSQSFINLRLQILDAIKQ